MSQFFAKLLLKRGGYRVFQPLCLIVDLVPRHPENLRQHALDQVMTNNSPFGDLPSLRGKPDVSSLLTDTKPSFVRRFRANVTAGLVTESQ